MPRKKYDFAWPVEVKQKSEKMTVQPSRPQAAKERVEKGGKKREEGTRSWPAERRKRKRDQRRLAVSPGEGDGRTGVVKEMAIVPHVI